MFPLTPQGVVTVVCNVAGRGNTRDQSGNVMPVYSNISPFTLLDCSGGDEPKPVFHDESGGMMSLVGMNPSDESGKMYVLQFS